MNAVFISFTVMIFFFFFIVVMDVVKLPEAVIVVAIAGAGCVAEVVAVACSHSIVVEFMESNEWHIKINKEWGKLIKVEVTILRAKV